MSTYMYVMFHRDYFDFTGIVAIAH